MNRMNNKKSKIAIIILTIIAALAVVGVIILLLIKNANSPEKFLSLGQKYLEDSNYEEAIAAFEKTLKVDPVNTDAYIGMADAYIGMEDYENAREILENALSVLKENKAKKSAVKAIEKKLEEVEKLIKNEYVLVQEFKCSGLNKKGICPVQVTNYVYGENGKVMYEYQENANLDTSVDQTDYLLGLTNDEIFSLPTKSGNSLVDLYSTDEKGRSIYSSYYGHYFSYDGEDGYSRIYSKSPRNYQFNKNDNGDITEITGENTYLKFTEPVKYDDLFDNKYGHIDYSNYDYVYYYYPDDKVSLNEAENGLFNIKEINTCKYDDSGKILSINHIYYKTSEYDEYGIPNTSTTRLMEEKNYEYIYDNAGKLSTKIYTDSMEDHYSVSTYSYEYDKNGNISREILKTERAEYSDRTTIYAYKYEKLSDHLKRTKQNNNYRKNFGKLTSDKESYIALDGSEKKFSDEFDINRSDAFICRAEFYADVDNDSEYELIIVDTLLSETEGDTINPVYYNNTSIFDYRDGKMYELITDSEEKIDLEFYIEDGEIWIARRNLIMSDSYIGYEKDEYYTLYKYGPDGEILDQK